MRKLLLLLLIPIMITPNSALCEEMQSVDSLLCGLPFLVVCVDSLSTALEEKGITRAVLRDTMISFLQAEGIEVVDGDTIQGTPNTPALRIHVDALMGAGLDQVCYSIRLELMQTVRLVRNEKILAEWVPTWGVSSIGLYTNRWREELLKDVLGHTATFADAFLAANPAHKD